MPQKSTPASGGKKEKDIPKKKSTPASGGKTDKIVRTATEERNKLLASGNKESTRNIRRRSIGPSKVETKVTNENKKMEVEMRVM